VWLYYSWDIAKSFFPKSANELCQVGKVNESLLSLKYLFPINERQLKSTSVIETETENLDNTILEIKKSENVNNQDKEKLIAFVTKTKSTVPLLTNEKLLSNETKEKIRIITEKINVIQMKVRKIR
jgi:taurine transport system permease protein